MALGFNLRPLGAYPNSSACRSRINSSFLKCAEHINEEVYKVPIVSTFTFQNPFFLQCQVLWKPKYKKCIYL